MTAGSTLSHFGICVSDLERSLKFYTEALGFELTASYTVGSEFGTLMEVAGDVVLQSRFIKKDGMQIELLRFDSPGFDGDGTRRPVNRLGLTHLSLWVDNVDRMADRIRTFGGTVLEHTRSRFPARPGASTGGDFLYCTDPDGIRIELMLRVG